MRTSGAVASDGGYSALGLVLAAAVGATEGSAIPVRIDFDAPAGCSDAAAFLRGIKARTSRARPAQAGEQALRLTVRLTPAAGSVHGELSVVRETRGTSTREVDGATCEEVVDALALTAALVLDPSASLAPSPDTAPEPSAGATASASAPAPSPPTATSAPPSGTVQPPSTDHDKLRETYALGAQVTVAQIVKPGASLGGALTLRGTYPVSPSVVPSLGLSFYYLRSGLLDSPDRARVALAAMGLTACPLRLRLLADCSLEPCAFAMGGWLSASGRDLSHPESVGRSWWSAGGLLRATAPLGAVAFELEAGISAPLYRRRFVVGQDQAVVVGETPTASALVGVGLTAAL